uniref:Uncharacterized protein n=1 Tax=Talaromyces marneffei PM1 TaxID=1077442 RepID=A0A093V443_TALMA
MSLTTTSTIQNLHRAAETITEPARSRRHEQARWKAAHSAPSLFKSLTTITNTSSPTTENGGPIPTIGKCATHLELLEVFFALRYNIVNSAALDATFGIKVNNKIVYRKKFDQRMGAYIYKKTTLRDDTYQDRRREKWDFYLKIAVVRFGTWIKASNKAVEEHAREKGGVFSLPCLPPLDILMVWHAFLLNPIDFQTYCCDKKLNAIRRVEFPWEGIQKAINTKTWSYKFPEESREWTKYECQIEPDLYQYLEDVGATSSPVASTLSRFGDPKEQMVLSERENQFVKNLVEIQVGLQQEAILQLTENVKRQASFVDKMHNHLWICSPAVSGTLCRAIDRYNKFLKLFVLHPGKTLVPTLDIDLVWHTHQCSAVSYEETMRTRTGRYVNHDDKIGKEKLGHGANETKHLFRTRFGQEYSVCLCWDCEMLATALEKAEEDVDLLVDDLDMAKLAKQVAFHGSRDEP